MREPCKLIHLPTIRAAVNGPFRVIVSAGSRALGCHVGIVGFHCLRRPVSISCVYRDAEYWWTSGRTTPSGPCDLTGPSVSDVIGPFLRLFPEALYGLSEVISGGGPVLVSVQVNCMTGHDESGYRSLLRPGGGCVSPPPPPRAPAPARWCSVRWLLNPARPIIDDAPLGTAGRTPLSGNSATTITDRSLIRSLGLLSFSAFQNSSLPSFLCCIYLAPSPNHPPSSPSPTSRPSSETRLSPRPAVRPSSTLSPFARPPDARPRSSSNHPQNSSVSLFALRLSLPPSLLPSHRLFLRQLKGVPERLNCAVQTGSTAFFGVGRRPMLGPGWPRTAESDSRSVPGLFRPSRRGLVLSCCPVLSCPVLSCPRAHCSLLCC